jgi:hypothetical protein
VHQWRDNSVALRHCKETSRGADMRPTVSNIAPG